MTHSYVRQELKKHNPKCYGFLKKQGCLTKYYTNIIDNYKKYGYSLSKRPLGNTFMKHSPIIGAFVWCETPEDHKHWSDLYDLFNKINTF